MSGHPDFDRRLTPSNGHVAAAHLRGQVEAERFVHGEVLSVAKPVVDLLRVPGGRRERQLLAGQSVTVFDDRDGWAFAQACDGYVGYLRRRALQPPITATHRVNARSTHTYPDANFKAHEIETLSFGSLVQVCGEEGRFLETLRGFVPRAHLTSLETPSDDPVGMAELFLGTPYLWGGNSGFGIDCSGLVQGACLACAIQCPGDSDMQETALGEALKDETPQRGDLYFWKGHVAWILDEVTLLHANAHHMAVTREGIADAIARIEAQGGGPVTTRKRLRNVYERKD